MKAVVTSLFAAFVVFAAALSLPAPGLADGDGDMKNCYSISGEARYGALAYKHIVIVTNRCDITLQCEVWTDVDPSPRQSVSVEPQGKAEVLVRAVSPARAFKAFGECKK